MKSDIGIFSILDSPALGGAENYLLSNLDFLSQRGFKIYLATYNQEIKKSFQKKFNLTNLPYRLDLIGNKRGMVKFFLQAPLAAIWLIKTLVRIKKNHLQVIVYTPGFTERLFFSPLIKLLGLKLIWLEYGPIEAVLDRNFKFPKILYHLASYFPDHIVTISKNSQRSMLDNSLIKKNKTSIIHPGIKKINSSQLKKLCQEGSEWKKQRGLEGKKIIAFVGRLATEKEADILLKAFSLLKLKNIHLIIVGTGPEKKVYKKLAKELKISDHTLFVDYISENKKNMIISASDIFVFPSAWKMEGFGITTIEAMMVGTAVISTGAGPQQEIISDQKTGLLFRAHDSTDLSRKIKKLLSKKNLRERLAASGRKKTLTNFTQSQMHQKTLELLQYHL